VVGDGSGSGSVLEKICLSQVENKSTPQPMVIGSDGGGGVSGSDGESVSDVWWCQ